MEKYAVLNTERIDYSNRVLQKTIELPEDNIQMGSILKLDALKNGEMHVHVATKPTKSDTLDKLVIVTQLRVPTDERKEFLDEYVGKKGQLVDARTLKVGEGYSISAEGVDGDLKEGNILEVQDNYKIKSVETATSGSTVIGKIVDIFNGMGYFVVGEE